MPTRRYAELSLPGDEMDNFVDPGSEDAESGRVLDINIHQADFAARLVLTARQYAVFCALRKGDDIEAISVRMEISPRMVYKHFERLRRRLQRVLFDPPLKQRATAEDTYIWEAAMLTPPEKALCPKCQEQELEEMEHGYYSCSKCQKVYTPFKNIWRYVAELKGFVKANFGGDVKDIMVTGDEGAEV